MDDGAAAQGWPGWEPMKSIGMAALSAAIAILSVLALPSLAAPASGSVPGPIIVVNTWPFVNATAKAWSVLTGTKGNKDAITAVVEGVSICENLQCDHTVGFGGSPDETGGVTLDALVMDGKPSYPSSFSFYINFISHLDLTHTSIMFCNDQATHWMRARLWHFTRLVTRRERRTSLPPHE